MSRSQASLTLVQSHVIHPNAAASSFQLDGTLEVLYTFGRPVEGTYSVSFHQSGTGCFDYFCPLPGIESSDVVVSPEYARPSSPARRSIFWFPTRYHG